MSLDLGDWAALAAFLSVTACATTSAHSERIRGPDGQDNWIAITCKGAQVECLAEAGRRCPNGYEVQGSGGHEGAESHSYASVSGSFGVSRSSSATTYAGEMLIQCKGAPVEGSMRECMEDNSCKLGEKCVFDPDARLGRCQAAATSKP